MYKGLNLESALYLATLTGSVIHVDTDAHWEQLLMDAQPAGAPAQREWDPVRQALAEITFPVDLNSQRVAQRISEGDVPPLRTLLRRLRDAVADSRSGPAPQALAKQLRQARGKVERTSIPISDSQLLQVRLDVHVPSTGFSRHEVQRLLVMFAGVTRPRTVPYALRLLFDEPEDERDDASDPDA